MLIYRTPQSAIILDRAQDTLLTQAHVLIRQASLVVVSFCFMRDQGTGEGDLFGKTSASSTGSRPPKLTQKECLWGHLQFRKRKFLCISLMKL